MVRAAIGFVIGTVLAFLLTRLMSGLLFDVSTTDFATFIIVSVFLIIITLAACYVPARRATRVDPMTALKYE